MLNAKKLVAVVLRLFACANFAYFVFLVIFTSFQRGSMSGGLPGSYFAVMGMWALLAVLLYIYAVPLAGFIAHDIDED